MRKSEPGHAGPSIFSANSGQLNSDKQVVIFKQLL